MIHTDNKKIFARNLKRYMEDHDVSRSKLSKDTGFPYSTISDWLNANRYPRIDRIEELANYFNIEKSQLIEESIDLSKIKGIMPVQKIIRIPILGEIACGEPIFAEQNYSGFFMADPNQIDADFSVYAIGDSMIDANIYEGDLVFLNKTSDVENGAIAAVIIGDTATLKKVRKLENAVLLEPCNDEYDPLLIDENTEEEVHIIGEMVGVYSERKN